MTGRQEYDRNMTGRQDDRQDDRQRTLGKYMINAPKAQKPRRVRICTIYLKKLIFVFFRTDVSTVQKCASAFLLHKHYGIHDG
jgi:hypothetical protein